MKNLVDKDFKKDQVREARHKLLRVLSGTTQHEKGWGRRSHSYYLLMSRGLDMKHF